MAYKLKDKDGNEIINLYLPRKCVEGSKFEGRNILGMYQGVFKDCINLESVEFEGPYWNSFGIPRNGDFENCTNLTTIILNEEEEIPEGIPNYLQDDYEYKFYDTFKNCTNLITINTDGLSSKTKINFNGADTLKNTGFVNFNFSNIKSLNGLIDCQNLISITTDAVSLGSFSNNRKLESITFNNPEIYNFGPQIFYNCFSLTNITYNGTIEQWKSIEKTNGWKEELAWLPSGWRDDTLKVHCIDGDTPLVGILPGVYKGEDFTDWDVLLSNNYLNINNNIIIYADSYFIDGKLVVKETITNIYDNTFQNSQNLTGIDISYSQITELGSSVFSGSPLLKDIYLTTNLISIGESCFSNCPSIENLNLSNSSVSSIGYAAFENCTGLKTISFNFEPKVQSIGDSCFKGCSSLLNIDLSNTEIEEINQECFMDCSDLGGIILSDTIHTIGENAFSNCTTLYSVDFKDNTNLTTLSNSCFSGCTNLSNFYLPNSITNLEGYLFDGCEDLIELNFNGIIAQFESITKDENWNTYSSLEKVICTDGEISLIPESAGLYDNDGNIIKTWTQLVNDGDITINNNYITASSVNIEGTLEIKEDILGIETAGFSGSGLTKIILNEGLESIGVFAFENSTITSIEFPSSLKVIDEEAFESCHNLQTIDLSNTQLETLGNSSFYDCINLEEVKLPNTLIEIGAYIFDTCDKLTNIEFNGSMDEWNNITKDEYWSENSSIQTITCTDGVINLIPEGAPGLYLNDGGFISWNNLIEDGIITLDENNKITQANNDFISGKLIIDSSISDISNSVFAGNQNLTGLEFYGPITLSGVNIVYNTGIKKFDSKNLKNIPQNFMGYCQNLEEIIIRKETKLDKSYSGFNHNYNLKNIIFEEGITEIVSCSLLFSACTSLESITFPDSLIRIYTRSSDIGGSVFEGCTSLKNITLGKNYGKTTSTSDTFYIPGDYSQSSIFRGCNNVQNIYYNGTIGEWFLSYSSYSTRRNLSYRKNNTSICLPIKCIDGDVLQSKANSSQDGVDNIASAITFNNSHLSDLGYTINNYRIYKDGNELDELNIVGGYYSSSETKFYYFTVIANSAFKDLRYIKKINLPECVGSFSNVSSSSSSPFLNCNSLEEINFNINVLRYKKYCFYGADVNLKKLDFNNKIISSVQLEDIFGSSQLQKLEELTFHQNSNTFLANNIFNNLKNLKTLNLGIRMKTSGSSITSIFTNSLPDNSLTVNYPGEIIAFNYSSYFTDDFKTSLNNLRNAAGNVIHCLDGDCDFDGNAL